MDMRENPPLQKDLAEELLESWLALSMTISNRRIVERLSYNEAKICNLLYRRKQEHTDGEVTATELCQETGMLKSAMNATLRKLEKRNLIQKNRSEMDRRQYYVSLNMEHMELYLEEHQRILELVSQIIVSVGEEKIRQTLPVLEQIARSAGKMLA